MESENWIKFKIVAYLFISMGFLFNMLLLFRTKEWYEFILIGFIVIANIYLTIVNLKKLTKK